MPLDVVYNNQQVCGDSCGEQVLAHSLHAVVPAIMEESNPESDSEGPADAFWDWAFDRTLARANDEGWTAQDCDTAMMQGFLLSYKSQPHELHAHGDRFLPTSPDDFMHNAPWNDWNPPSKSLHRFNEARANKKEEIIDLRVRARLCASGDAAGLRDSVLVFASVEVTGQGTRCLRLRRGCDTLASMKLRRLQFVSSGERMIALAPRHRSNLGSTPVVFLSFENDARIAKFFAMLQ